MRRSSTVSTTEDYVLTNNRLMTSCHAHSYAKHTKAACRLITKASKMEFASWTEKFHMQAL